MSPSKIHWVVVQCVLRGKCLKETVPTAKSDKKAIRSLSLPSFLTPKILFLSAEKSLFEKGVSRRERQGGRLPCWPINQSVINEVSDHCSFLNRGTWLQASHCTNQMGEFNLRNQQSSWVCFWTSHGTSQFPSPLHPYRVSLWFRLGNGSRFALLPV